MGSSVVPTRPSAALETTPALVALLVIDIGRSSLPYALPLALHLGGVVLLAELLPPVTAFAAAIACLILDALVLALGVILTSKPYPELAA